MVDFSNALFAEYKTSHYGSLDFDVSKILMTKLFSYERAFLPISVSFENIDTMNHQ